MHLQHLIDAGFGPDAMAWLPFQFPVLLSAFGGPKCLDWIKLAGAPKDCREHLAVAISEGSKEIFDHLRPTWSSSGIMADSIAHAVQGRLYNLQHFPSSAGPQMDHMKLDWLHLNDSVRAWRASVEWANDLCPGVGRLRVLCTVLSYWDGHIPDAGDSCSSTLYGCFIEFAKGRRGVWPPIGSLHYVLGAIHGDQPMPWLSRANLQPKYAAHAVELCMALNRHSALCTILSKFGPDHTGEPLKVPWFAVQDVHLRVLLKHGGPRLLIALGILCAPGRILLSFMRLVGPEGKKLLEEAAKAAGIQYHHRRTLRLVLGLPLIGMASSEGVGWLVRNDAWTSVNELLEDDDARWNHDCNRGQAKTEAINPEAWLRSVRSYRSKYGHLPRLNDTGQWELPFAE